MFFKTRAIIDDFSNEMIKNNVSAHAASAAFFVFLSLIPMLLVICTIIPYTPITEMDLIQAAKEVLPESFSGFATSIISEVYSKTTATISIAIIALIWSAAKGILSLMRALNSINKVDETRNYFILRFWASVYTLGLIIIIILSLFIMVYGKVIQGAVGELGAEINHVLDAFVGLRFLFTCVLLTLFFALLYSILPNKKLKYASQLPGAIFAAIGWTLFSFVFSIYVERTNAFGMYGSLTTLIIVLLWLYICMTIFMMGAQINRYFRPLFRLKSDKRKARKQNALKHVSENTY